MKELKIYFINVKDCRFCKEAFSILLSAKNKSTYSNDIEIEVLDSEDDKAIKIGVEYNIYDLPACVIGLESICDEEEFTEENISNLMEKYFKNKLW